jgi:mono/diheme cytochrome c family protein
MARSSFVLSLLLSVAALRSVAGADEPATRPARGATADPQGIEFFERNIRPVLAEHCYGCHSEGAIKVRGQLLLDTRQGVAKGGAGGPVVVARQPDKSRLIEAIRWTDPDLQMPPKKQLSPAQIEQFEQWVKMGAPDPRDADLADGSDAATRPVSAEEGARMLWALKPVEWPEVPVGVTESANPIDAFIATEYRSQGLTPVGRADRSALLRRVSLDLIGIPPTAAEQDAFLNDTSPGAYDKVVDRCSPASSTACATRGTGSTSCDTPTSMSG